MDANGGAAGVPEAVREDRGGPARRRRGSGDGAEQLQHVQLRREEGAGAVHRRRAGRQEQLPRPRVPGRRHSMPRPGAASHAALSPPGASARVVVVASQVEAGVAASARATNLLLTLNLSLASNALLV